MKRLIFLGILVLIASLAIGCDGEGEKPQKRIREFEPFSFAVITDLHIGRGIDDSGPPEDYGAPGVADYDLETGKPHIGKEGKPEEGGFNIRTDKLVATVDWLNKNYQKGNIKFLVILGDISDTAEMSEFFRAKKILDNLEIPYIPLIGNHDIWPLTGRSCWAVEIPERARLIEELPFCEGREDEIDCAEIKPEGSSYFEKIFWNESLNSKNIERIKSLFGNSWQRQKNREPSYLQNYAFSYQGINFLGLDYGYRKSNCLASLAEDFPETWEWLKQNLERHKDKIVITFSHYPFLVDGGFLPSTIEGFVVKVDDNDVKALSFGGHIHPNTNVNEKFTAKITQMAGMIFALMPGVPVIITKGMTEEDPDFLRIVRVKGPRIEDIDYSNEPFKSFDSGGIVTIEIGEPTPTPTIAPTPTPIAACPPEGEPKFVQGQEVITTDDLRVRKEPNLNGEIIKTQPKGTLGKILEGPVCADDYIWWKVEYQDGTIGWSAENWLEKAPRVIKTQTPVVETPTLIPETPTFTPTITPTPVPETPTPVTEIRGKIAFVSDRDGNAEIYLMNADGTNQVNLTNHPAGDWDPAWSPDGKKIAFVSDRDGDAEIYVMDANGNLIQQLTNNSAKDEEPDWSPDGQYIIFASDRDGNDEIYIMNSDGSNQRNLTNFPEPDQSPRWSPDGQKIVFTSEGRDNFSWISPQLFIMNPDGSGVFRPEGVIFAAFLERPKASDWSADEKYIAFSAIDEGIGGYSEMKLYELESNYVRLIGEYLGQGLSGTFSSDGKWLSFASTREDKNYEIYLMFLETREIKRLTENKAQDWDPAWIVP